MALELDDTQAAALLALLGLPESTADVQLIIDTAQDATRDPMAAPPPSEIAAAAERNGMEVIDTATADALRRDAQEGRRIAAAAARQRVEATVDDAINKGKVMASRRTHWVSLIEADPGMADVLAATPNETAVPLTEVGHSADNPDLAKPATWFY